MNVMLASIVERTREIGVRLAVGGSDWAIQGQFLAEAVLLTSLGGLAGVTMSLCASPLLARALGWSAPIPPVALVIGLASSSATGVIFGFLPARRAARLDPVEALRSE
jgi:putative ABC transport system permease protein